MNSSLTRILHVDDEPDMRELVKMTLEILGGFSVTSCPSGAAAVEAAVNCQADLVILDVMMPGIDGPTALSALRADPRTRGLAAVFMTAKGMPSEVARLAALGALDVIAKPFDPTALCEQIRASWAKHQARVSAPGGDEAALQSHIDALRQRFIARAVMTLKELEALAATVGRSDKGDLAALRDIVHKLAGSGAAFGYPEISRTAAEVEECLDAALTGDTGATAHALDAVRNLMALLGHLTQAEGRRWPAPEYG